MIVSLLLQNWPHEQQGVVEICILRKHELFDDVFDLIFRCPKRDQHHN